MSIVRTDFLGYSQNNRFQNGLSRAVNAPRNAFDRPERAKGTAGEGLRAFERRAHHALICERRNTVIRSD